MGYARVRAYAGGIAEWIESGAPVERGAAAPRRLEPLARRASPGDRVIAVIDAIAARSVGEVLALWLAMVAGFGLLYWAQGALAGPALLAAGAAVEGDGAGLLTALYFSIVTATSVGYGDVVPLGAARALAMVEAVGGLLFFGFVVSKFLSRRQEEMLEEIHRTAFHERLGRVRTSLHFVLTEIQAIALDCQSGAPASRSGPRAEGAAMILAGELRSIHDLLYRPQQNPDEETLETILASLASVLGEMTDLLACLPREAAASGLLRTHLARASRLASEICGECVPRSYAPHLKEWMDRIQRLSERLAGAPS